MSEIFQPLPEKRYNIIYADPPWRFETFSIPKNGKKFEKASSVWRNADVHYPTVENVHLENLDVHSIAADDSVLFMWATWPLMEKALDLIKAWGFEYKTLAFDWVKLCKKDHEKFFFGMGYWTRSNPEPCLLATRGKPSRLSRAISNLITETERKGPQVVVDPIRHHSRKPDIVRDKIVELCGDLPRIELFARPPLPEGWDAWGNEV